MGEPPPPEKRNNESAASTTNVSGGVNVNADQVNIGGDVVGRDKIVQNIRHILLTPWAWIAGFALIAAAIILAAAAFNIVPLQALFPAPTPTAFAPASPGKSLIIVADFEDRSGGKYQGIDPAQYVYEKLQTQVQQEKLNVRVERLPHTTDDNHVQAMGDVYSATLVLWGWYDALTITPHVERIKTRSEYQSTEEGKHLSLADPTKVEFSIVTDLPSQSAYMVLFVLGLDAYSDPANGIDVAIGYFSSAIDSIPTDITVTANPAEANYFRGNAYHYKGDYDRAIADWDRAIQLKPDYADAYNNRGLTYDSKGDHDRAIADYDKAVQLKPDFAEAYLGRGAAYNYKGDYDRAIADYDKAVQLKPDYAGAYNNRGIAYDSKGDHDQAIADYGKAIQLKPDYADAYNNRGVVYNSKGDHDRAIADFDKAIQLKPDYANAYNNRGIAYNSKGDHDRAIADFDKAIQLKPNFAAAYNNRCYNLYELGRYQTALPDCEKAIQLKPDDPNSLDSRAHVYQALGRNEEVIADFKRVLELSNDPELRKRAEEQLKALSAK